jgi:hypothetical protein
MKHYRDYREVGSIYWQMTVVKQCQFRQLHEGLHCSWFHVIPIKVPTNPFEEDICPALPQKEEQKFVN